MKYLAIDPISKQTSIIQVEDSSDHGYREACRLANLTPGEIDFGTLYHNPETRDCLNIIVYEYSLMEPKVKSWFSIAKRLFNGPAIIFASNYEGATIDIKASDIPQILWLPTIEDCEAAISIGAVFRPQSSINGKVYWEWNRNDD